MQIKDNTHCSNPMIIKERLERISLRVLRYLEKFQWTLTYDGKDYIMSPGAKGCGGKVNISKHDTNKDACTNRSHGYDVERNRKLKIGL
jgi:hypothetical protein